MTLTAGVPTPTSSVGNTSGLLFSPSRGGGAGGRGSLELIIGPMFAGKTSELTRRLKRAAARGKTTLLLKWADDKRYADHRSVVVTHDGEETRARSVERLEDAANLAWSHDVIGIDEGQVSGGRVTSPAGNPLAPNFTFSVRTISYGSCYPFDLLLFKFKYDVLIRCCSH